MSRPKFAPKARTGEARRAHSQARDAMKTFGADWVVTDAKARRYGRGGAEVQVTLTYTHRHDISQTRPLVFVLPAVVADILGHHLTRVSAPPAPAEISAAISRGHP